MVPWWVPSILTTILSCGTLHCFGQRQTAGVGGENHLRFLLLLFGHCVVPSSLWLFGLQHIRLPCPSLSPGVCSDSRPLSRWCYLTISSSATPSSFCLKSFPASDGTKSQRSQANLRDLGTDSDSKTECHPEKHQNARISEPRICNQVDLRLGLPRWLSGEESTCQCRRHKRCRFNPWVRKIPWSRK